MQPSGLFKEAEALVARAAASGLRVGVIIDLDLEAFFLAVAELGGSPILVDETFLGVKVYSSTVGQIQLFATQDPRA